MDKTSAIYCRVSSRDQSHASQLPDLERWAEAHAGAVEWFKNKFTGRCMNRPGMDRLLEQLRAGKLGVNEALKYAKKPRNSRVFQNWKL